MNGRSEDIEKTAEEMDNLKNEQQNNMRTEQLEKLLKERERLTNKSNSRVMAAVTCCILIMILLPYLGGPCYYKPLSYNLALAAAIILAACFHFCLAEKYSRSYHKYIIISSMALSAALMYCAIGADSIVFFAIPLLLSGRYGSRKICLTTYLISVVLNAGAGIINAMLDFRYYHYLKWISSMEDVAIGVITPLLMMTTVMAVIVYGMVASDKKGIVQILRAREAATKKEAEFQTGADLQMNSLPKEFNIAPNGEFSTYARIIPAKETAGDFYDFFVTDKGKAVFIIGDVSDKGIPAALYMMSARNTIRALCRVMNDPAQIVSEANRILLETSDDAFVTLFIAIVDMETGAGEYVNAGHEPPIIRYENGSCGILESEPQPIVGAFDFAEYKSNPLQMDKGTVIFVYTDGVNEAESKEREQFSISRIREIIQQSADCSPENICLEIESANDDFADESKHSDDRTMLAVRWEKEMGISDKKEMTVSEESIAEMIDTVNSVLKINGCPEDTIRSIDVAIDEIGANLVDYSKADRLVFEYECGDNHIRMSFTDNGIPFNPEESNEFEDRDVLAIGGLGIHFIKNLMDEVGYGYEKGNNVFTITKYWD